MSDEKKLIKSSIWYTISNFSVTGIHFIVTPIFARILSQEEYGLYSNYTSWLSIFQIITSLMLLVSLYNASKDYKKTELDSYIISMLALSGIFTVIIFIVIFFVRNDFESVTGINRCFLPLMFLVLLTNPGTNFYQLKQRLDYKYKSSVFISLSIAVTTLSGALLLTNVMNNKLFGRIFGSQIPNVIINIGVLLLLLKKSKKINFSYWKYVLPISVPYIFHSLGVNILSASDRIMITKICGSEDNSLYSLAYSCAMIITTLVSAISSAIDPWLLDEFHREGDKSKVVTKKLALGMFGICVGVILFAPEVILVIGGQKYLQSISVMPPVIAGLFFQFVYSLYSTIEQFAKKTLWMAIATAFAAFSNLALNAFLLPIWGYKAAAYTTLFCYALLFSIHFFIVKRMGYAWMFDGKNNVLLGCIMIIFSMVMVLIYDIQIARLVLCVLYCIAAIYTVIKYQTQVKEIIKQFFKR